MLLENLDKTLEQLEGDYWPDPGETTRLVTECHRLRRVPLGTFTIEDLRIMIGQGIGLSFLLPIAFKRLRENYLVAGNFYEGDLLQNVIRVPAEFWGEHRDLFYQFADIVRGLHEWRALLEEMIPLARSAIEAADGPNSPELANEPLNQTPGPRRG